VALLSSFRARLLMFVLPLLVGALSAALVLTDLANTANARGLIAGQLAGDADGLTLAVGERSAHLLDSARLLTADFAFKRAYALGDDATLRSAMANHLGRISDGTLMVLMDLDGAARTTLGAPEGSLEAFAPLARAAMADGYGEATGILFLAGRPHQLVVTPLLAPDVVAWVAIGFELDDAFLGRFAARTPGSLSLIAGREGAWQVQASTLPEGLLTAFERDLDLAGRAADRIELGGAEYVMVTRPLATLDGRTLLVVLQRSLNEALAPYLRVRRLLLILFAGALLLSILGALLVARSVSRPVSELSGAAQRVGSGDLSARVMAQGQDEIGLLASRFNAMVEGLQERDRTRDLLGKVVSRQIADELMGSAIELGGEERECTILFSDLRGFTSLSEGRSPVEILALLNRYFSRMTAVVDANGGVVDKFIGDALMALFGVPVAAEDAAARAVATALGMQDALAELNEEFGLTSSAFSRQLRIGMGLATGEVVAGNMGSTERLNYTVIGDAVNLASRLEGLSKAYRVATVVSEATLAAAAHPPALELDRVRVQGQIEIHRVFTLVPPRLATSAFLEAYAHALDLERVGEWGAATRAWESVPAPSMFENLIAVRSDRCRRHQVAPPTDWDGVISWSK